MYRFGIGRAGHNPIDRDCSDGLGALQSQRGYTLLNPRLDRQPHALMAAVTKIDLYGHRHNQLAAILNSDYRALGRITVHIAFALNGQIELPVVHVPAAPEPA